MINRIISHYKIIRELGRGATGEVYLAEDTKLPRKVALKFLSLAFASHPELRARFMQEANAATRINHPNVVMIHDVDEVENRPYIVMEYVEGETLGDLIARKELSVDEILDIVIQICEGLSKAHEKLVLHRDIKPANILIDRDGRVRIVDFGLAKLRDGSKITIEGAMIGTVPYMSPEQAEGKELDQMSDIFSLGVVLYELIAHRLPFEGGTWEAITYTRLHCEPEPLARYRPGISTGLQRIVDKVLEKRPENRYQNMESLLADLKRQKQILPSPLQLLAKIPSRGTTKSKARSRWIPLLAFSSAFILLLAFLLASNLGRRAIKLVLPKKAPASASIYPEHVETKVSLDGDSSDVSHSSPHLQKSEAPPHRIKKPSSGAIDSLLVSEPDQDTSFSSSKVSAALTPVMGKLRVSVKPAGAIYIDGELQRANTTELYETSLPVGSHQVRVESPPLGFLEKTVTIEADKPQELIIDFNKIVAVTVTAFDEYDKLVRGKIYVGHADTGETIPKKLLLRVGRHTITVHHEGYIGEEQVVDLEDNRDEPLKFILKKTL